MARTDHLRRSLRAALACLTIASVSGLGLPPASWAADMPQAHVTADAWYETCVPLGCDSLAELGPTGVAPGSVNPYPETTLQIGAAGASITRFAAIEIDVPVLAPGMSWTATLRVSGDETPGSGSSNTAAARLRACRAQGKITDGVRGGLAEQPEIDCTVSAPLRGPDDKGTYQGDVTSLLGEGITSRLALVPDAPGPSDSWQIALNDRNSAGGPTVQLLTIGAATTPPTTSPDSSGVPLPGPTTATPVMPGLNPTVTAAPTDPALAAPPAEVPSANPVSNVTAAKISVPASVAANLWLLPFLLLGCAWALTRLVTAPLRPDALP